VELAKKVYLLREGVGVAVGEVDLVTLGFAEVVRERHFVVVSNIINFLQ